MRHGSYVQKLGRQRDERRALLKGLIVPFFRYGRIRTTKARAKVVRRIAERLITRARKDTPAHRRFISRFIQDGEVLNRLFKTIAPRYVKRNGGYTRIILDRVRQGDSAQMVVFELVGAKGDIREEITGKKRLERRKKDGGGAAAEEKSASDEKEKNAVGAAGSDDAAKPAKKRWFPFRRGDR